MKIRIDKLNHQGQGIGKINGKIIFVNNALPGEEVEIEIIKDNKKYSVANVVDFITKSSQRIESECKYYGVCGGCQLSHIAYEDEIIFKQNKINDIFNKINIPVNKIVKSDKIYNYRNKVTLKCVNNFLGYYEKESNNFVKIDECMLCEEKINDKIKSFKNFSKENIVLKGYEEYTFLNNYKFKVDKDAFFQINSQQTLKIYNKINDYIIALNKPNVLDLYCGVGSIGIFISKYANEVLGIEINKNAIKCANDNKKINKIKNISFKCDNSDNVNYDFNANVIIVDPPRSGLTNITINKILNMKPENIVYLSCDPMTLVRDLEILKEEYDIKEVNPYDMFPRTFHVECLCVLRRQ